MPCSNPAVSYYHPMVTQIKGGVSKPKILMNLKTNAIEPETTNFKQASKDSHWHQVMLDEYTALINNNTWELVPCN